MNVFLRQQFRESIYIEYLKLIIYAASQSVRIVVGFEQGRIYGGGEKSGIYSR